MGMRSTRGKKQIFPALGHLCAVLGIIIHERHEIIAEYPKEGCKDGEGPEGQGVLGVAAVPEFVQPRAEKAEAAGGCSSLQEEQRDSSDLW